MTLDAGKSLRSVITEKEQRHGLMFVQDYKYSPTWHLLYITSESKYSYYLYVMKYIETNGI